MVVIMLGLGTKCTILKGNCQFMSLSKPYFSETDSTYLFLILNQILRYWSTFKLQCQMFDYIQQYWISLKMKSAKYPW